MLQPLPLAPTIAALPLSPREALHAAAQLQFRQVQISATQPGLRPRELDASGRRDVSSLLRRLELECTGLDFLIPSGHYIDPARADRAAGAAMAAIELAADLGRASLTVEFSAALTGSNRDDPSRALLDAIIAHAERFGVALANLGSVAAPIDGLGIALDLPGLAAQRSLTSAVAALKTAAIVSVRCSGVTETGARVPFGRDSRIDPAECQLAIAGAGYQRAVVLDARGWADPLAGLEQSAAAWSAANPFLAR